MARKARLAAVAKAHEAWVEKNLTETADDFDPAAYPKDGSDYNQHNVDVDADAAAQDEFTEEIKRIFGESALTAAKDPDWDPKEHPRGPDGKFVESGGGVATKGPAYIAKLSDLSTAQNIAFLKGNDYEAAQIGLEIDELKKTGLPEPKAAPAPAPAVKISGTASAPSGGKPITAWTKTIHTTKYADGAVVAVHSSGERRIVWNEKSKKFAVQSRNSLGTWQSNALYTKKGAYDAFKADKTSWLTPASASLASTSVPPAAVVGASALHKDAVAQVGIIPVSAPDSAPKGSYSSVSPADMADLQEEMFQTSGKSWTSAQKAAIGTYTTSPGYQIINAPLRDDSPQIDKFTPEQLAAGIKQAVEIQSAMLPLPTNLEVYRQTDERSFGFLDGMTFEDLKKLEGAHLKEHGFLSTAVEASPNVPYQYAKKPIKMIIKAPKGTPAVWVPSAQGWGNEKELLLAAGSDYVIEEVREVSPGESLNGEKYQVTVRVIPGEGLTVKGSSSSKSKKSKPAPSVSAPAPAPVPKISGAPAPSSGKTWKAGKFTSTTAYKSNYAEGEVVGITVMHGSPARVVWENGKFHVFRIVPSLGEWELYTPYVSLSKASAVAVLKGFPMYKPPAGTMASSNQDVFTWDQIHSNSKTLSAKSSPVVPPSPAVSPSSSPTPPPAPTAKKTPKLTVAQIEKQNGTPPKTLKAAQITQLMANFHYGVPGQPLATDEADMAKVLAALVKAVNKHNETQSPKLNLLQAINIIDGQNSKGSTKVDQKGDLLLWLKTAIGKSLAPKILANESLTPAPVLSAHEKLKASLKDPYEIGTPEELAPGFFGKLSIKEVVEIQKEMEKGAPLTIAQQKAIMSWIANPTTFNEPLRGKLTYYEESHSKLITNLQDSMRPLTQPMTVWRITGGLGDAINEKTIASLADLDKYRGAILQDPSFLATGISPGTFHAGSDRFEMVISLPEGTPATFAYRHAVGVGSEYAKEEEMLLAAGLHYRIDRVEYRGGSSDTSWNKKYRIYATVVPKVVPKKKAGKK